MILLIFIFCPSICLAIHFAISKDGLVIYKKIRKRISFLQPCKLSWRKTTRTSIPAKNPNRGGFWILLKVHCSCRGSSARLARSVDRSFSKCFFLSFTVRVVAAPLASLAPPRQLLLKLLVELPLNVHCSCCGSSADCSFSSKRT